MNYLKGKKIKNENEFRVNKETYIQTLYLLKHVNRNVFMAMSNQNMKTMKLEIRDQICKKGPYLPKLLI